MPPQQGDGEDAVQGPHEADVDAGVAVDDVAQLVGHHPLELVAVELIQGPAGDGDGRVRRAVAGGQGIDAGFVLQDVDLRDRHPRGQGHFLDQIAQAPLAGVRRARVQGGAAQFLGHLAAAGPQPGAAPPGRRDDQGQGQGAGPGHHTQVYVCRMPAQGSVSPPEQGQQTQGQGIHQGHHRHHRQGEEDHQDPGAQPGPFLMFEESHGRTGQRISLRKEVEPQMNANGRK